MPASPAVRDYAAVARRLWDPIGRAVARQVAPLPGETVLDACCGLGSSALPLAAAVGPEGQVDAVDLDPDAVAHLRANELRPAWLRPHTGDAVELRVRNVDHVVCVHGIAFFADPTAAGRALAAKARWGGTVTFATWAPGVMSEVGAAVATALAQATAATPPASPRPLAAALSDPDGLRSWLRDDLDLVDVRIERKHLQVPAEDPEVAWLLVLGTAFRRALEGLDAGQLDVFRDAYLTALGDRPVDATTLIATARRDPQ